MIGVLLGVHLAALRLGTGEAGAIVAAGLAGVAAASLLATLRADVLGRRALLVALALAGAAGAAALAWTSSPAILALASFLGMVNGMGRDRGAAVVLEQAALPSTVSDQGRTRAFAVYTLLQDAGHALGSLLAGLPAWLGRSGAVAEPAAVRLGFGVYGLLLLAPVVLYLRLSPALVAPPGAAARGARALSPASRRILWRIGPLFALDSLGGGFLTTALLSVFFVERFGAGPGTLGPLFFAARVANAASHLAAAWLARRIGLLNTMVFTHLPSSLLLVTVAIAPSFPVAAALFLLREGLVEMDVPTRQSYLMAVVRPEERTFAGGVTQLLRLAAWAVGPAFAGLTMERSLLRPLLIASALKVAYDVLLYLGFRRLRPPEEAVAEKKRPERGGSLRPG